MTGTRTARALVAAGLMAASASAAAVVVNLDIADPLNQRQALSFVDPVGAVGRPGSLFAIFQDIALTPGDWIVTPVADQFTAANRFGSVGPCNPSGASCGWGFEHTYYVRTDPLSAGVKFGDGEGPGPVGAGYYSTAGAALLAGVGSTFTVFQPTTVRVYWVDDIWGDNKGGISLNVSLVPEPHEWAMMLAGLGVVGWAARRRRPQAPASAAAA